MDEEKKALVSELNPYLLCSLCSGYMVDASTIIECLHSFCKSCIYKYLESSKYCPICDVQIHKTKPHLNIKADKTLQTLIYKLVPNLLKNEMQRRQEFFDEHPSTDAGSLSISLPTEHHHIVDRYKFLKSLNDQSNWISFCIKPKSQKAFTGKLMDDCFEETSSTRYFFCPPEVRIYHVKKLLKEKFELNENAQVEIFHADKTLADFMALASVTESNDWDKKYPFDLEYCIKAFPSKTSTKVDDISNLQNSLAFKARLQARMREIQLKNKYFRSNKRKLKATGFYEDMPQAKKRRTGLCMERVPKLTLKTKSPNQKSISKSSLVSTHPESMQSSASLPSKSAPSKLSLAFSATLNTSRLSVLAPSTELPRVHLNQSFSSVSPTSSSSPIPLLPALPQSSAFSSSHARDEDDPTTTDVHVPQKASAMSSSLSTNWNRNIFDLVQPLLNQKVAAPGNTTQTLKPPVSSLVSLSRPSIRGCFPCVSIASSSSSNTLTVSSTSLICFTTIADTSKAMQDLPLQPLAPVLSNNTSPADCNTVIDLDDTASSSNCTTNECCTVDLSDSATCCTDVHSEKCEGNPGVGTSATSIACDSKTIGSTGCIEAPAKFREGVCEMLGRSNSRSTLFDALNVESDAPFPVGSKASGSIKVSNSNEASDDSDSKTLPVKGMQKFPLTNHPRSSVKRRSNFFEKFSRDLHVDLESIGITPHVESDVCSQQDVISLYSSDYSDKEVDEKDKSALASEVKMLKRPSSNLFHHKSTNRTKVFHEDKVGFEASCRENNDEESQHCHENDKNLLGDVGAALGLPREGETQSLQAASGSYKISKREVCGLFMDMSKKYLKEFPANGFAFASTLSSDSCNLESGYQRRSKQKPVNL